ncbi:MAG: hypothetical protein M1839_008810 [Geoglossum umbratile]|nr:MAG: hypothetical protein M1839_008810 [Geoglossum umbratile]
MATLGWHALLFLLCLPFSACQSSCAHSATAPVQVPIRNVTLPDQILRRGVALSIGTPPQNFALQAYLSANNTFLYDVVKFCPSDISPIRCVAYKGGTFDLGSSSTWAQAAGAEDAGASLEPGHAVNTSVWGTDKIRLNSGLDMDKFPVAISRSSEWTMNTLGLGRNSTILNALFNAGRIGSRSWGLFWGLTGAEANFQMDGSLVFGGYDVAKVTGDNLTENFQTGPGCSLVVTVRDIIMNHPNGSSTSIIGTGPMKACVAPDVPVITIPLPKWLLFAAAAPGTFVNRSYGINLWGMVYKAENVYAGDLTFALDSGLNIRIPNHQLVVPDLQVGSDGQIQIANDTTREILLNSLQGVNANDMPLLGQPFLSSSYLLVNNDEQKFTLWKGQPTLNQKLVGIVPSTTCTSVDHHASSTATSQPSKAGKPSPKVTRGTIAGLVVGLSGAIAFGTAAILLWRMRRAARRMVEAEGTTHGTTSPHWGTAARGLFGYSKHELQASIQPPQEMSTTRHPHFMDSQPLFELPIRTPRSSTLGTG